MAKTFKALSLLLSYPSTDLQEAVPAIREALARENILPAEQRRALEPLLEELARDDIYELEGRYFELFDRSRGLSLHLFEHVHGQNLERGQAMVDLGKHYLERGFFMTSSELPDYLPLFLEFLSQLPFAEAQEMLGQPVHVLAAIEERLAKRETKYRPVFQALLALAKVQPDPAILAELRQAPDPDPNDFKAVDEDWEEEPVTFGGEAHAPTGLIARIRAARRPAAETAKSR